MFYDLPIHPLVEISQKMMDLLVDKRLDIFVQDNERHNGKNLNRLLHLVFEGSDEEGFRVYQDVYFAFWDGEDIHDLVEYARKLVYESSYYNSNLEKLTAINSLVVW